MKLSTPLKSALTSIILSTTLLSGTSVLADEKIKGFHFYDLKFSIDCKKAGLRLTTALIKTIHNSHGLSKGPDEKFKQAEEYLFSTL